MVGDFKSNITEHKFSGLTGHGLNLLERKLFKDSETSGSKWHGHN